MTIAISSLGRGLGRQSVLSGYFVGSDRAHGSLGISRFRYTTLVETWELVYYESANGRSPVREYLDELSAYEGARLTFDLDLLQELGIALGAPHVRNIRGPIWELRTGGRTQHRVLYAAVRGRRLVLLHAFTKKTPTTPPTEIRIAENRLSDYLTRNDP